MLYLAPYIGTGTDDDPYRPVGSDQPGLSAIDLRPDPTVTDGWALVRTPEPFTAKGAIPLGELDEIPSVQGSRGIENRLGLDRDTLRKKTLRNIIADLLILWGDEDSQPNGRWKKLLPDRLGHLKVYLGELIYDLAVPAGGSTITESWDYPDATGSIDGDLTWGFQRGSWNLVSGAAHNDDGSSEARAEHDLPGADHYAEAQVQQLNSNGRGGCAVRFAPSARTFYAANPSSAASVVEIMKRVAGSYTLIENVDVGTTDDGGLVRLEVEGSTLTAFWLGVSLGSWTDTSITDGTRAGIVAISGGANRVQLASFAAGSLAAGPVGPLLRTIGGYLRTPNGILRPA